LLAHKLGRRSVPAPAASPRQGVGIRGTLRLSRHATNDDSNRSFRMHPVRRNRGSRYRGSPLRFYGHGPANVQ
jgi:hypothetical protein